MISVKTPGYKTTILLAYTLMLPPQPHIISLTPMYDAVIKKTTQSQSQTTTTEPPTSTHKEELIEIPIEIKGDYEVHENPAFQEDFEVHRNPTLPEISSFPESPVAQDISTFNESLPVQESPVPVQQNPAALEQYESEEEYVKIYFTDSQT